MAVERAPVRPAALPRTCCPPRLWLWPGQAVYAGAPLGLSAHSGSVSCLVVAAGGTVRAEVPGLPPLTARSVLVPPRLTHRVVADAELVVFCYLDPGSRRHRGCRGAVTAGHGPLGHRHRHEGALAASAGTLDTAAAARAWLDLATGGPAPPEPGGHPADPRIRAAVAALRGRDPGDDLSAAQLAALVGLSPSRFLHLFRAHTGTSLRRYRQWLRMLRFAAAVRDAGGLTAAAADAGFASPSHLSTAFRAMFGLPPRHLLGVDVRVAG